MAVTLDASSPPMVVNQTASLTALTTASFTPPAGSVVVVKIVATDGDQTISSVTASAGFTLTQRANLGTGGSTTRVGLYTGIGTGVATTITANFGGASREHTMVVRVWSGAQLAATPAVKSTLNAGTAPSDTITTTADGSVVDWAIGEWNAVSTTTRTYRSGAVEQYANGVSAAYNCFFAHQSAATAGAQTFGMTAPTGQLPTTVAVEVQQAGAAPAATRLRPPARTLQAVARSNNY